MACRCGKVMVNIHINQGLGQIGERKGESVDYY